MLAREMRWVVERNGLTHVRVTALPARYHFQPDLIVPAVEAAVGRARAEGAVEILIGYADCGTGGQLAAACERLEVAMLPGPHCFALYQGLVEAERNADDDIAVFYITDTLARQPDAFLWRPLGLDRHPDLLGCYFAHYERAAYLAQSDDLALERSARAIADRLGLSFELRRTGLGDLEPETLARLALVERREAP